MSGPVDSRETEAGGASDLHPHGSLEVLDSRESEVGRMRVRRALPRRAHRTVGAWCFADHMGPASVTETSGVDIGPHPHIGLQTVTWLLAGEILHRDSLGSEQVIRPGQLNLMTAGVGVAHSEEATGSYRGELHGVQLWVAQPESTRHGEPAFEHHPELPQVELSGGRATVVVGELGGTASPARCDSDHVGAELDLDPGASTVPIDARHEHALVVLDGAVEVEGTTVGPGRLAYLGTGRDEIALRVGNRSRVLLIGGEPFDEEILMWWNFVARTREEMHEAHDAWSAAGERFGTVRSPLERIAAPPLPWGR